MGSDLTKPDGEIVKWGDVFQGPNNPRVVGLYYGAGHCRPCKVFISKLAKVCLNPLCEGLARMGERLPSRHSC